jgi:hypothetical protein
MLPRKNLEGPVEYLVSTAFAKFTTAAQDVSWFRICGIGIAVNQVAITQ